MRPKFRLAKIHIWSRDGPTCTYRGPEGGWDYEQAYLKDTDGIAIWEIWPKSPEVGGPTHANQPFQRGGSHRTHGTIVWGWNGNEDAPTLSPSFLYFGGQDWPRIHLFLRNGKVDNLGDSEADFDDGNPPAL